MMSVALIVAILGSVFMMNVQGQFVSCPYFTEVYVSPSTKVLNDTLFPPMVRGLVNSINNYSMYFVCSWRTLLVKSNDSPMIIIEIIQIISQQFNFANV